MPTQAQTQRMLENQKLLRLPQVRAFLDGIARVEGADYGTIVFDPPGAQSVVDFSQHPQVTRVRKIRGKETPSSAAGRYQMIDTTYAGTAAATGLSDFSPQSQDINAVELLRRTGAVDALIDGDLPKALAQAGTQWAGIPNSSLAKRHNQPSAKAAKFQTAYAQSLTRVGVPEDQALRFAAYTRDTPEDIKHLVTTYSAPLAEGLPHNPSLSPGMKPAALTAAVGDLVAKNTTAKLDIPSLDQALAMIQPVTPAPRAVTVSDDALQDLNPARITQAADDARMDALRRVFGSAGGTNLPVTIETALSRILREENGEQV